ncbi:hypothetical protein ACFOEK_12150 [Litoribrevibacter euphylliae]|uniref:Uncharacterized protein n=1 Tax=Litoribrevibacter euphylliae TaxID=1834034 RepID=A0ABV7HKB7_9GAMM
MTPQQQANLFRALKDGELALEEQLKQQVSEKRRQELKAKLHNFISVKVAFLMGAA